MHFVVTGAGGFIGHRIALALARAGHQVTACYRNNLDPALGKTNGITLAQGDIAEGISLPDTFHGLVHCAADIPGLCPDPQRLTRSNVDGAENLFTKAQSAGANIIVNLSSMSVYGTISVPKVTEDVLPDHPDVYGQSKLAAEKYLHNICSKTNTIAGLSIRLPGVVGRGSHHNFLSGALAKILAGEPLEANNPEALFNNIIFIEDLATFIGDWVKRASPGYEVTNIAACDPISIRDVIGLLYTETRHSPQVVFNTSKNNPFLIALDRVNFLGYRPKTVRSSLKSFVQDVINTDNGTS